MKPQLVSEALDGLIQTQTPVFLWGSPGVGKSALTAQAARRLGRELADIRVPLLDAVDLRGLPCLQNGKCTWLQPDFLPTEGAGVLFLDELNAAPQLVQAACYQLVLDRRLADYRLPEAWSIVAAGMARAIEDIVNPLVDWRAILRRFVSQSARSDYSWQRPNRRHVAEGLYLPSVRSEELGVIVVAVDTSGSIDPTALEQFSSEIAAIMEECRTTLSVFYCDSAIEGRQNYEPGEEVKLQPVGGGGTDFRPVFDAIEAEGMTPACLIYLTDLDGRFPDCEPWYPVIWACVNARRDDVPFGEKVRME